MTKIAGLLAGLAVALFCAAPANGATGGFERTWGTDVIANGPANVGFEICTVAASCQMAAAPSVAAPAGEFNNPNGVAIDATGNVYVADYLNNRIQKFGPTGNFLLAWGEDVTSAGPGNTGTGPEICTAVVDTCKAGTLTGPARGGEFLGPLDVAVDSSDRIYVADQQVNRIQRFDSSGNFQLAWGKDVIETGPNDNGTAFEICIAGVDTCQAGNSLDALGGSLQGPVGVATDITANVYVSDRGNNRVQKFSSGGAFDRAWGQDVVMGGGNGFEVCVDGINTCKQGLVAPLTGGAFADPAGLATDAAGDVYVSDNNAHRVQKFSSLGAFDRAWGEDVASAGPGNTGTGFEICVNPVDTCKVGAVTGPARGGELFIPIDVAIDSTGAVYVADQANQRIQRFSPFGTFQMTWGKDVDEAAGTGFEVCTAAASCQTGGFGGLGGEILAPSGLATDTADKLYVGDGTNNRVQVFGDPPPPAAATPSVAPPAPPVPAAKKCKKKKKKGKKARSAASKCKKKKKKKR